MRDVYALMTSKLFNKPYEYCLELKGGEPYLEGKYRRSVVKYALLEEYEMQTSNPVFNLLCIEFPFLVDMPHHKDSINIESSLVDWIKKEMFL